MLVTFYKSHKIFIIFVLDCAYQEKGIKGGGVICKVLKVVKIIMN